jgi:MFS family permease
MFEILKHRTYRHLFLAQVIALIGTGLITIALSLLAYDLAKDKAAQVLGIALAIKMIAYIMVAPVASAYAERLPRKKVLVTLDIIRADSPFLTLRNRNLANLFTHFYFTIGIGCLYPDLSSGDTRRITR